MSNFIDIKNLTKKYYNQKKKFSKKINYSYNKLSRFDFNKNLWWIWLSLFFIIDGGIFFLNSLLFN